MTIVLLRNDSSSHMWLLILEVIFFMTLYIYLLYEIYILKTYYILNSLGVIYGLILIVIFKRFIIESNYIELIPFFIFVLVTIALVIVILVFPFILYIPGDNSQLENILIKSKLPHAQYLIDYKKNLLKKYNNWVYL